MPASSEPFRQPAVPAPDSKSVESMRAALERTLTDATGAEADFPPPVPDHTLLHRIGSGAYGDVWLARSALGTLRAVKVVYRARFREGRPYEREFNGILKYEPVSRSHEGLVQVLHAGRDEASGCFYYVMELADPVPSFEFRVSGSAPDGSQLETHDAKPETYAPRTLSSDLALRARLPPVEAAQFVLRLAGALAHLHSHGLVHRDIKPSNVIFVGGQPKLADIGLVTDVGSSHSFVGTEGFIPPEGPGTPQADLYGLGKLLYELATGRDRMDFPQLPPGVTRLPDGEALLELNEVMTRACAPEPRQRYASATELQAELNLFLAGRSLRRVRHVERHLARLKRFAGTACAFLVLAAAALWFSGWERRHALELARAANERARVEAENRASERRLRERAESAEQETQRRLHAALLEQARATVRSGELGQRVKALDALRRAAAISNAVELRREVFAALALPDLRYDRDLPIGPGYTLAEFNPDFARVAFCRGTNAVELRAVSDFRLLASLSASTNLPAHVARWSGDGRFLVVKRDYASGGARADWEVWDVANAQRVLLVRGVPMNAVAFHPRLHRLLTGGPRGRLTTWDVDNNREVAGFRLAGEPVNLEFAPDGGRFATSYSLGAAWIVSVHEATNGAPLASHVFADYVHRFAWHPDGRWLAVADAAGTVHRMEAQLGETQVVGHHKADAVTTVFTPDGDYLMTGGWDRELVCWNAHTMQRAFVIGLDCWNVQVRADGRACALRSDQRVQLHTFERPAAFLEMPENLGVRLRHAAFSHDGRWIGASAEKRMGVWDLASSGPAGELEEAHDAHLFFMPDGLELFASRNSAQGNDGFRWRLKPAAHPDAPPRLEQLPIHRPDDFTFLCLRSNSVVLTGERGSHILASEELESGNDHWARTSPGISGVSPDGRWLGIYRSFSRSLYVYRLPGLERVAKLIHLANIADFRFSPLGDAVAIASSKGVELWSTQSWERTRTLTNFMRILYTPDAKAFWLTRDMRTAGLYDARTVEPLLLLPTGMLPLALSPDGQRLAVSVEARRLQVWNLAELRSRLRELGLDWAEP
jgi:WD40 repeat protein